MHCRAASTVIPLLHNAAFTPSIQPNLGLPRSRPPLTKIWKKFNEIQLTKNKADLHNRKITNHPPSPEHEIKQLQSPVDIDSQRLDSCTSIDLNTCAREHHERPHGKQRIMGSRIRFIPQWLKYPSNHTRNLYIIKRPFERYVKSNKKHSWEYIFC